MLSLSLSLSVVVRDGIVIGRMLSSLSVVVRIAAENGSKQATPKQNKPTGFHESPVPVIYGRTT
jgi:hypothetical protein